MDSSKSEYGPWASTFDLAAAARALSAIETDEEGLAAADNDDGSSPQHIDGYAIDKQIGRGAGGNVYRAIRTGSDQYVALKILHHRLGESPGARRAWRELDMLAQLRLPSLPRLLDHGEHDGRMYLVTEFIDGVPLLEFAERENLKLRERARLLAGVAEALLSLHEFGVIHRDIKPQNILINEHSQPVLVDLGIATLLGHNAMETLTQDGTPIGTPAFMSPEQARGETRIISTRSDLYSLGATAYVLLTGHTPHAMDVTIHEAIRRVAHDPPRDPHELKPSLPKPLAAIMRKAVAVRPEDRYESAGAFAADLRRWLNGEHVEAGDMSFAQRIGRFIGKHPIATTAATCILIVALTLSMTAVSVWWLNMRPNALEIDPVNRAWVRLVSHSGRELHRWDQGTIWSAQIVDRPVELGGGRIALIRFGKSSDAQLDGQLAAFDIDNPGALLWATGVGDAEFNMPTPISLNKGDTMRIEFIQIVDVFAESPGPEILVAHRMNMFSAMCIRIYTSDGRIVYEIWHDGIVYDAHWLPYERLLILAGINSEAFWDRRGYVGEYSATRPAIVFALLPEFGRRYKEWIRTPGGLGTFDSVWYHCLYPPGEVGRFRDDVSPMMVGPLEYKRSRYDLTYWRIPARADGAFLILILDTAGRIVDRFASDGYRIMGDTLPDPSIFSLQPLPPLIRDDGESAPEADRR